MGSGGEYWFWYNILSKMSSLKNHFFAKTREVWCILSKKKKKKTIEIAFERDPEPDLVSKDFKAAIVNIYKYFHWRKQCFSYFFFYFLRSKGRYVGNVLSVREHESRDRNNKKKKSNGNSGIENTITKTFLKSHY